IEEQKIEAVARPQVELISVEPVRFKATVPVKPSVNLNEYQKISVEHQPVEITEEQVEKVIDQLRQQQAVFTPVERPVRYNDVITMTVAGYVEERQIVNEKGAPYKVMKDLDLPLPGFPEKLEGAVKGEERVFSLVFPETHPAQELRGKPCDFKVTVDEIKEQRLPAVDDAFVKSLGAGAETIDAFKEKVKSDIKARAEGAEHNRYEDEVLQKLVDCAQIDYSPILVDIEVERLVKNEEERAARSGKKLKDLLKATNQTEVQLRAELRPIAEKRLVRGLALGQLADDENIQVSDEEIAEEIEKAAKGSADKEQEVRNFLKLPSVKGSILSAVLTRKTMARLIEIAQGEKQTTPAAESGNVTNDANQ
ncbi:MAG: trigger factor, partial [Dehalococcoidia bacterium]|nr:trigger factor [Dehalococcoidia bacterium]